MLNEWAETSRDVSTRREKWNLVNDLQNLGSIMKCKVSLFVTGSSEASVTSKFMFIEND